MALTIKSNPSDTCSVSSEMIFVIEEAIKSVDPVTYPNYKYILYLYVNSVLVARIKATPDPDYSFGVFDISSILQSYVPAYGLDVTTDILDYDIRLAYQVKLGEEYGGVEYPDLVTDSTRYTFKTYKKRPFTSSSVIYNGLASNMPLVRTSYTPADYELFPYYSNVSGITDLTITYKDAAGNTITTATFDNSTYVAHKLRQFNVQNSLDTVDHALFTGPFSLRVNYVCSKYTPYTLIWLNPFGGYESQQFGLVSKKTIDITKKSYSQTPYKVSSGGSVLYTSSTPVYYGSKRNFISTVKTKLKLTSHLLTDDEYTWLADMFISPEVYLYISGIGIFPVSINQPYEYRNYLNSRLTPLEFEVEYSDDYNSQLL